MYKVITINGKDYHLEYSIEASLYADCVTKITTLLTDIESGQATEDIKKLLSGFQTSLRMHLRYFMQDLWKHRETNQMEMGASLMFRRRRG